jgi:hypothetical protein
MTGSASRNRIGLARAPNELPHRPALPESLTRTLQPGYGRQAMPWYLYILALIPALLTIALAMEDSARASEDSRMAPQPNPAGRRSAAMQPAPAPDAPAAASVTHVGGSVPVQPAPAESPRLPIRISVTHATHAKRSREAERQARYRERHGDSYRERHAAYMRAYRRGDVGKGLERRAARPMPGQPPSLS